MKEVKFENGGYILVPEDCTAAVAVRGDVGTNVFVTGNTGDLVATVCLLMCSFMKKMAPVHRMAFLGTLRMALLKESLLPDGFEMKLYFDGEEVPDDPKEALKNEIDKLCKSVLDEAMKCIKNNR